MFSEFAFRIGRRSDDRGAHNMLNASRHVLQVYETSVNEVCVHAVRSVCCSHACTSQSHRAPRSNTNCIHLRQIRFVSARMQGVYRAYCSWQAGIDGVLAENWIAENAHKNRRRCHKPTSRDERKYNASVMPMPFESARVASRRVGANAILRFCTTVMQPTHIAMLIACRSRVIVSFDTLSLTKHKHGYFIKSAQELVFEWKPFQFICPECVLVAGSYFV